MKNKVYVYLLLIFTMFGCNQEKTNAVKFHASHIPERKNTPFSAVVETEQLLFLSGQIGKNHQTEKIVSGGIKAETKQAIENIKAALEQQQSSLEKVVKCTVILRDIADFKEFNSVYVTYFPQKPARTTFAASGLAADALIEIDVIAVK